MNVLLINSSTRKNGYTYLALSEVTKTLNFEGVETEIIQMGGVPIRDCIGCNGCAEKSKCAFEDGIVNEIIKKSQEADGFAVYYAHPSGQLLSPLNRLFYTGDGAFSINRARL